jgi:hypothetical protein
VRHDGRGSAMKMGRIWVVAAIFAGGCASQEHAPLLFGQAHTLGVSIGASTAGTPDLVVGFKDANIAHIPTVAKFDNGGGVLIQGDVGAGHRDAYATFGQFESSTTGSSVGLGKFFATGLAARRLADGFACKLSSGTDQTCVVRPAIEAGSPAG